jgi:magnesium transporter
VGSHVRREATGVANEQQPPYSSLLAANLYQAGATHSFDTIIDLAAALESRPHAIGWIQLYRPDQVDLTLLSTYFALPDLALEDVAHGGQRSKIDPYDGSDFIVVKQIVPPTALGAVHLEELHIVLGAQFMITIRHEKPELLEQVQKRLAEQSALLQFGTPGVLYAVLDDVVDGFRRSVADVGTAIEGIEQQVFDGRRDVSRNIHELSRSVIDMQRAIHALRAILTSVTLTANHGEPDPELERVFRDIRDHVDFCVDEVDEFRPLLRDMLTVNANFIAQQQNEDMKRISAWAAIIFAPTLVGTVYGMNFAHMPELRWAGGYPVALLLMIGISATLFLMFRGRGWL